MTSEKEQYKCGDCGITSDANRWVFDWEDPVEDEIYMICPHCSVRSTKQILTNAQ